MKDPPQHREIRSRDPNLKMPIPQATGNHKKFGNDKVCQHHQKSKMEPIL